MKRGNTKYNELSFCNASFEQGRHKPVQVKHEHFAHASILFAVRGQLFRAAAGGKIVLTDKLRAVLHHIRRKQAEPQADRPRPRESVLEQDLLAVVPWVVAEQLGCSLAGPARGRALLDLCADQQPV